MAPRRRTGVWCHGRTGLPAPGRVSPVTWLRYFGPLWPPGPSTGRWSWLAVAGAPEATPNPGGSPPNVSLSTWPKAHLPVSLRHVALSRTPAVSYTHLRAHETG